MITQITTTEELKQIWVEAVLNNTDKITKISDGSALNGFAYGTAKLGQKALKDIALIESHLYPDTAVGSRLDDIAKLRGIAPRLKETKSTVFVRLVGEPGTQYVAGTQTFSGGGMNFDLIESVIIPEFGFTYAKLISQNSGMISNISPLAITKVNPIPSGHQYVINEFAAVGGRNNEDDDDFRKRLKDEINILSRSTLSNLEQIFRKFQPNVLKVMNLGLDSVGDLLIAVASVNGVDFTTSELATMRDKGEQYFSMNELKPNGLESYGIKLINSIYTPIDVSFRVEIDGSYDPDLVRKTIQAKLNLVVDWRKWEDGDWIDWIDLINCVKTTNGVVRVLDNYFYPRVQFQIPRGTLPIMRGFQMLNLNGEIMSDFQGNLNPIYFPTVNDFEYQATVLKSL